MRSVDPAEAGGVARIGPEHLQTLHFDPLSNPRPRGFVTGALASHRGPRTAPVGGEPELVPLLSPGPIGASRFRS